VKVLLHVVPADGPAFDRPFQGDSLVIGRSLHSDLIIADHYLSRTHARLVRQGEALAVEDLGSRTGTRVNGAPVRGATAVGPGDQIEIGASRILLQEDGAAKESSFGDRTIFLRARELLDAADSRHSPNSGLRRANERLLLLNDVHRALARPLSLPELLDLILQRVFDHLRPERGAIFLQRPDGELYRAASRVSSADEDELPLSQSLFREVAGKGLAALVQDARFDERFADTGTIVASGVRSLAAAPLLDPEGCLGLIALDSRLAVGHFNEGDLELLVSLAAVAALRIRNVALAEEAAQRRRLEDEMALARRIQIGLLPEEMPHILGWELHGGSVPSRAVSGDYYEVVERRDGKEFVLMVADVSGKGISAALLTACLEALSAAPFEDGLPPDEICTKLSRLLYRRTPPERYATAFLGVLERISGTLHYTNAGHNPALLLRAGGGVEWLGATGVPIGLLPAAQYRLEAATLFPGDTLVLYTDGITEAVNPEEEEYGIDRLAALASRRRDAPLGELAAEIERDLGTFAQGVPFTDDRTLVMLRRRGGGEGA
jgi:serine phosphatase RsbU (regulator of sigma subunit)